MNLVRWSQRAVMKTAWRIQGLGPARIHELELFEDAMTRAKQQGAFPQEFLWLISRRIAG